jgi:hypothetical protein
MRYVLASLFCIFVMLWHDARAGAWTQYEGQGQLILNNYYYAANKRFDNKGKRQYLDPYRKYEFNPYVEYGLTGAVTIGANLSFQVAGQRTALGDYINYNLGDSEFFTKGLLYDDGAAAISFTSLLKVPGPSSRYYIPKIGSVHPDLGGGLSAGYGFSLFGLTHFVDVDTLYRYRLGVPQDQVNLAATLGVHITSDVMIMPQVFATYRVKSPKVASFTQSAGDDYNEVKLQLSGVYAILPATSLQLGVFADIDGKNTGVGRGALLSVWEDF